MVRCCDLHAAPFLSFPPPGRKDFFHALGTLYRQIPVISGFLISTTNSKIQGDYENERTFYRYHACERVERDFSDSHHFFFGWVNGKSILLESGYVVSLNGDRKVIFVFLILNRRRELGLPIFQSDLEQFCKLCKQAKVVFPEKYFAGV